MRYSLADAIRDYSVIRPGYTIYKSVHYNCYVVAETNSSCCYEVEQLLGTGRDVVKYVRGLI